MKFENKIIVNKQSYSLVKKRRDGKVAVYKSKNFFLRIGEDALIKKEIEILSTLAKYNFPIPKKIKEGRYQGAAYFIEQSLGEKHFSDFFCDETKKLGSISDKTFHKFLLVSKRYAIAQLKTAIKEKSYDQFSKGIKIMGVCRERPALKGEILRFYKEAKKCLSAYPFVLTQGDCNPHNLYPKGLIDFETAMFAPAGYDLVSNIFSNEFFPPSSWYEYSRRYTFTAEQKKKYLETMDAIYRKSGLPAISENLKYFEFCRAIWLAVNMDSWPRLQKYRYDLLVKKFLIL